MDDRPRATGRRARGVRGGRIGVLGPTPVPVAGRLASASYEAPGEPEVSVVVSTRGRAGFLPGLLAALAAQTLGPGGFEVVVVDDGSPDDTWEVLGRLCAATPLRLCGLRLAESAGQGPGRNTGVAHARAPVVAFTDDDCLPAPGWLAALTAPLLGAGLREPPPVVVQGRTVPWPDDAAEVGPWFRSVWVLGPTWLFETCNIAYRRSDLVTAGGFPSRGQAPSDRSGKLVGEDALLGWRVVERGGELAFSDGALVHHRHLPASYREWLVSQRGKAAFPLLAARSVLARRAFWHRWFLARRTAAFDLAVLGAVVSASTHRARWTLAVAPWLVTALADAAHRPGRHRAVRLAQVGLGDLVGLVSLAAGSVRARTLVL